MFKKFGLAVLIVALVGTGTALAEEGGLGFDLGADFYGKYIWRGINVNDDYVFQPSANVTYEGFTAGVWGNVGLSDYSGEENEFNEVDYYVDYTCPMPGFEGVSLSVGLIYYHFPSVVGDTTEVYWGLGFDVPLDPSVTVYHDIDAIDGTYVSFAIGHDFGTIAKLAEDMPVGMEFGASLGWGDCDYNKGYWADTENSGLNDLSLSLSFPFEVAGFSVSPSLNYVSIMDGGIRGVDEASSDYFFTGISLSKSF